MGAADTRNGVGITSLGWAVGGGEGCNEGGSEGEPSSVTTPSSVLADLGVGDDERGKRFRLGLVAGL